MKFKIFIIEDDKKIADIMAYNLEKWSYECILVEDFSNIEKEFVKNSPHIVLLDIILPYYDGFYWCAKIRKISKVPIIFISSKNTNMDIVMAINMGGDDFIVKPFSINILVAKVNALLRRTYSYKSSEESMQEYNGIILDMASDRLSYKDELIELTNNEKRILSILLKNNGEIVSREDIQRSLWKNENFIDDNTLTVNINRIRKKLKKIGLEDIIKTRKGSGYIVE